MKQFAFLFDNLIVFYLVFALVAFNTILAVYQAALEKSFEWKRLTDCLRLVIEYSAWLIFGNIIDFAARLKGFEKIFEATGVGFVFVAGLILTKEGGKLYKKLTEIRPIRPEPDVPEQPM